MDERVRFVARLLDGEAMSDVCRQFGISRKTGCYPLQETPIAHSWRKLYKRIHASPRDGHRAVALNVRCEVVAMCHSFLRSFRACALMLAGGMLSGAACPTDSEGDQEGPRSEYTYGDAARDNPISGPPLLGTGLTFLNKSGKLTELQLREMNVSREQGTELNELLRMSAKGVPSGHLISGQAASFLFVAAKSDKESIFKVLKGLQVDEMRAGEMADNIARAARNSGLRRVAMALLPTGQVIAWFQGSWTSAKEDVNGSYSASMRNPYLQRPFDSGTESKPAEAKAPDSHANLQRLVAAAEQRAAAAETSARAAALREERLFFYFWIFVPLTMLGGWLGALALYKLGYFREPVSRHPPLDDGDLAGG